MTELDQAAARSPAQRDAESGAGAALPPLAWRQRLLHGLLVTAVALMTLVLPALLIQTRTYQFVRGISAAVGIYVVLLFAALARRQGYVIQLCLRAASRRNGDTLPP